jgi:hypothetical protein
VARQLFSEIIGSTGEKENTIERNKESGSKNTAEHESRALDYF